MNDTPDLQVLPSEPVQSMAFVAERLDIGKEYPIEATRLYAQPIEVITFVEAE